jgi:hypothetical protein
MAKIKVMMSFIDIHSKNLHPVGEVFEASEERISEIKSVSPDLIQVISESVVEAPKRKRKKVGEE